jgi:ATP synthase I chain
MTRNDDRLLQQIGRSNWWLLLLLLLISLFWQSRSVTLGIAAGGLLVILNFNWMGRSLLRVMGAPEAYSPKGFQRNYLFRLVVVACAIYLLLVRGEVHPLALLVGLSVVVLSLLFATIRRLY